MQIRYTDNLGRAFPHPTVYLIHSGIYLYKIHARQFGRISVGIDRPIDPDAGTVAGIRMIVGISPIKRMQYIIRLVGIVAFVYPVIGQARTLESQCLIGNPLREITLTVKTQLRQKAALS